MEQRDFIPHQQTKAVCDTFVRQRGQMCVRLIDGNISLEELEIGLEECIEARQSGHETLSFLELKG